MLRDRAAMATHVDPGFWMGAGEHFTRNVDEGVQFNRKVDAERVLEGHPTLDAVVVYLGATELDDGTTSYAIPQQDEPARDTPPQTGG
jgi:hypothetical protein